MQTLVVTTQEEIDALPERFDEFTRIEVRSARWIVIKRARENSHVVARENSHVVARENSKENAAEAFI